MKTQLDNTLSTILGQQYFDFGLDLTIELNEFEIALLTLMNDLSYTKFNQNLYRDSKVTPMKMMMLIVHAATHGLYSCRDIAMHARRDVFVIALLGLETHLSFATISRFIKRNAEAIEDLFYQLVKRLNDLGELGCKTIFQDGTKQESRAGRYTFVWKGTTEKNFEKCKARIKGLLDEAKEIGILNKNHNGSNKTLHSTCEDVLASLKTKLPLLEEKPEGRGHKADPEKKLHKALTAEVAKLEMYENYTKTLANRNSMSKTDPNAAFMRMKDDYMKNGQLKPAYNVQNAVDSGYVVCCTISNAATDYDTCIPMIQKLEKKLPWKYENYCADSGYDKVANHQFLQENGYTNYIKPQDWEISKTRKYRNDIGRYQNMKYDEEHNVFTCAHGKRLVKIHERQTRYGTIESIYQCKRGCKSCPLRAECMKKSAHGKGMKKMSVVMDHWGFRKHCYENLITEKGTEIRVNRSIQVEGSFGEIRNNIGFRRFASFGEKRVFTEWIIHCFSMNVMKYAYRKLKKDPEQSPFWYKIDNEQLA